MEVFGVSDNISSDSGFVITIVIMLLIAAFSFGMAIHLHKVSKKTKEKTRKMQRIRVEKSEEQTQKSLHDASDQAGEKVFSVKTEMILSDLPPGVSHEQMQKDLTTVRKYYQNSPNPKYHRSAQEAELEYRFEYNHGDQSQRKCDSFIDHARLALAAQDINERIRLLEETIDLFYKVRDWHYKTKGGMLYFQDVWEHCHNSQNPDFCWVENEVTFLRDSVFERDEIEPWILQSAEDGFMQPEIYKAFPDVGQGMLRKSIDRLVQLGKLEKNKEGRSYRITLTQ